MNYAKIKARAALFSILSNIVLILSKFIVGIMTNSVSIISEAIHSFTDLLAAIISFFSVRKSSHPADIDHQYGHGKYEDLSCFFEGSLIIIAAGYIINEAVLKISQNEYTAINTNAGIIVMIISVVVNIFISMYLFKVAKQTDSVALLADAMHLRTDIYTSAGVLIGLFLIKITHISILDPIVAIIVALIIIKVGFNLCFTSIKNLLDTSLPINETSTIDNIIKKYVPHQVISINNLKTRKSGPERLIEMTIVIPKNLTIEKGHALCDKIEEDLKLSLKNSQVTIHVEPCDNSCVRCNFKEEC